MLGYISEKLDIARSKKVRDNIERVVANTISELEELMSTKYKYQNYGKSSAIKDRMEFDFRSIDVSNLSDLSFACYRFDKMKVADISNWDTSHAKDMASMFDGCFLLEDIIGIEDLDTSSLEDADSMFCNCSSIRELDLSSWDFTRLKMAIMMFRGCSSLETISLPKEGFSNVKNARMMFKLCTKLEEIDFNNCEFTSMTTSKSMFEGCKSLKRVVFNDLSNCKISNCRWMFKDCENLEEIIGIETLPIDANVTVDGMFAGCEKLKKPDISNWHIEDESLLYYKA